MLPLAVATLVGTLTLSTGARIATLDLQTGTTHVIVSSRHPYFEFVEPSWSPDGRRLAYVREDNRCNRCIVIFVDGHAVFRRGNSEDPAWSADGRLLAFVDGGALGGVAAIPPELFVARPDGRGARFIGDGELPAWSPDGRLAYVATTDRDHGRICLVRPPHPPRCVARGWWPAWSRLGTLAYVSGRTLVASGRAVAHAFQISQPVWSPDATRIVYVAYDRRSDRSELWVTDRHGRARRLFRAAVVRDPVWSPDGRLIAAAGLDATRIVDLRGHVLKRLRGIVGAWRPSD